MSKLEFSHIGKVYDGKVRAVDNFNLTVEDGEFIVLVGPSGCGKSTLLRMVAGLESITEGEFKIDGKIVNNLPPVDRDISLVFQNYALYGNMTIYDNVGMSLKVRHRPRVEIYDNVMETSEFLGIKEFLNRFPDQLSGGQKQRVALGRSIARKPKLYLMDEPLSNLDAKLRTKTRSEIVRIQKELGTTTLYVTHDQVEAMSMADKICIIKDGIIQQVGKPQEVYLYPENEFVAGFIGMPSMNMITGIVRNGFFNFDGNTMKILPEQVDKLRPYEGKQVKLGFRAEDIRLQKSNNSIKSQVIFKEYLGGLFNIFLKMGNYNITATVSEEDMIHEEMIDVLIDLKKVHFFDVTTTKRIK